MNILTQTRILSFDYRKLLMGDILLMITFWKPKHVALFSFFQVTLYNSSCVLMVLALRISANSSDVMLLSVTIL